MTIVEILIWEATNVLLLIPLVVALVIVMRRIRRRPLFTEHDWLFLFGQTREKVLSFHFWIKFAVFCFVVTLIGIGEGYVLLPVGLAAFFSAVFLTALMVWRVAPKWLC
jgi:hypothetical protein